MIVRQLGEYREQNAAVLVIRHKRIKNRLTSSIYQTYLDLPGGINKGSCNPNTGK